MTLRFYTFVFFLLFLIALFGIVLSGCSDSGVIPEDTEPIDTTSVPMQISDFTSAEDCKSCHPQYYDEWSGSSHAYAIKDPVFQALRNVGQSLYIGSLDGACTKCHSAAGMRTGDIKWGPYQVDQLHPVSQEGVTCDICHSISNVHTISNAGFDLAPSDTKFGSTQDPDSNSFHKSEYSPLFESSDLCGSCHDLKTEDDVPLEAAYLEWETAGFGMTAKTCQDCHMPEYIGEMIPGGQQRTLHKHTFVGGAIPLIDFPNKAEHMLLVEEMLQSALSMSLSAPTTVTTGTVDSLTVSLTNDKTGHKVPTGTPFNRQMWLSVLIKDEIGNIIFESGQFDANGDLKNDYSEFPERDSALYNAQSTLIRRNGTHADGTWDAATIDNRSIAPNQTKNVPYLFEIPDGLSGTLEAEVKLRYRSFGPYFLRDLGLDSLLPIPIVDMNVDTITITIE